MYLLQEWFIGVIEQRDLEDLFEGGRVVAGHELSARRSVGGGIPAEGRAVDRLAHPVTVQVRVVVMLAA
jgi:hypothetical protein